MGTNYTFNSTTSMYIMGNAHHGRNLRCLIANAHQVLQRVLRLSVEAYVGATVLWKSKRSLHSEWVTNNECSSQLRSFRNHLLRDARVTDNDILQLLHFTASQTTYALSSRVGNRRIIQKRYLLVAEGGMNQYHEQIDKEYTKHDQPHDLLNQCGNREQQSRDAT